MFTKILIANRGEIACRIIKTARRMGIKTVAVYSDADARALHVRLADEAVRIGAAAASDSYLNIERIIAACRQTGAQAVHPGYGFLSERAAFPRALQEAGIAFIGPNPGAMDAMGDKIESKKCANAAKVSTVPGHLGVIRDAEHAVQIANEIGYPVMIKASAGGGGKGMRIAHSADEVADGFARSRSEASSSFGDDRVFVEKFIVQPRHIEIQILGDKHGNIVYLGERECSIQRRNQKVIEEAPSPLLDEGTRKRMGEQAVALARAVNYDSAGTVEFVCGQDKSFFFLEMNTRLQVEHPVTELITGIDLVEQMIRVAAGEPLALRQEDIRLNGWAVESRVYAEDPSRNFMPSTGRLTVYRPPTERVQDGITVRNDTGVFEGGEISIHYDPMIAKLVTHAPTRAQAIEAQAKALDAFAIEGISHNIPFLSALMRHKRWREGRLSTAFIADEFKGGFVLRAPEGALARPLVAVAAAMDALTWPRQGGAGLGPQARTVLLGEQAHAVTVDCVPGAWHVQDAATGEMLVVRSDWVPGQPTWHGSVGDEVLAVQVRRIPPEGEEGVQLSHAGTRVAARVVHPGVAEMLRHMSARAGARSGTQLRSPMPAKVLQLLVEEGRDVQAGDVLCIVEAMKMEISLSAEQSATVSRVVAQPGDVLELDAVILEFA
jgi:propionyl-CoA carboxylase alpha chain